MNDLREQLDTVAPNFKAFAIDVMKDWPEGFDIEGYELQRLAIKHGLLRKVDGGFDPEIHSDTHGCAEPGDDWYMEAFGVQGGET